MALGSHGATAGACCGSTVPLTPSAVTQRCDLGSVTPCSVLPVLWSWDAWIHGNFLSLEKSKSFNSAGNRKTHGVGVQETPLPAPCGPAATVASPLFQRAPCTSQRLPQELLWFGHSWEGLGLPRWFSGQRICLQLGDARDTVQSLGQEDPLEEGMATHSSILAWRIPRTEKPGGLQSTGSQTVG